MEMYLIKSAACLAVLLLFYKLLLEKENMHGFKRFYLLTSALAAIVIPLITFTTYVAGEVVVADLQSAPITSSEVITKNSDYLPYIFFGIYLLGVLFFSIKFSKNLRSLILKIRTNPKLRSNSFIHVLLSEKIQPHTFFSFIFFNKEKYLEDEIPLDVKIHEEAHARQKHSLDVLFVELLQIIFWFNPLIFLLKDSIKLNHEFLADQEVLKNGISTSGYQQTLLAYSSGDLQSDLVNPINYSSIKKRFTVMKTKTSKRAVWIRAIFLVPLLAGLCYGFSTKKVVERESMDFQKDLLKETKHSSGENSSADSIAISEVISITILKDENLLINSKPTSLRSLSVDIDKFIGERFRISGKQISKVYIETLPETPMGLITDIKEILRKSRISEIYLSIDGENVGSEIQEKNNYKAYRKINQDSATPEMLAEYNRLAKKYKALPKKSRTISSIELERMVYIYARMNEMQKEYTEKFPEIIVPKKSQPVIPVVVQDMATEKMVKEYKKLVKKYKALPKKERAISSIELERMVYIYTRMDKKQKESTENFPEIIIQKNGPIVPVTSAVYLKKLEERGAVFYFERNQITGKEAVEIAKKNEKLIIQVKECDSKKSIVKLSKDPFVAE